MQGDGELEAAVRALESVVVACDPEQLDGDRAVELLAGFARAGKIAQAGQALMARRIEASGAHLRRGHPTAAHLVAKTTGVGLGRAITTVEVGRRLRDQPTTDGAFRRGELSLDQAGVVSAAAAVAPHEEARLVTTARHESMRMLRDRARAVRLASEPDREARYRRQHDARAFRHTVDDEGMVRGGFHLPPDIGAVVVKHIEAETERRYRATEPANRHLTTHAQLAADALVALVTGTTVPAGRGAEVVVHVSRDALLRGSVRSDEICTVEDAGDVPVEIARQWLDDAFLKGVLVDGIQVQRVKHFGRRPSAAVLTALRVRQVLAEGVVRCSVPGCDRREGLEWDHIEPYSRGGMTSADNLGPRCAFHHREKTAREFGARPGRSGGRPENVGEDEGPAP